MNFFHNFMLAETSCLIPMKTITIICLLLISVYNSYGQWYVKKYHTTDIHALTQDQLNESLKNSKNNLLASGICAGIGAVIIIIPFGMGEDPGVIEQLLGNHGMNVVFDVIGTGVIAGSIVAGFVNLDRIGKIKSVLKLRDSTMGALNISPDFRLNNYTRSFNTGITLKYRF
jgi:hypothetical protein